MNIEQCLHQFIRPTKMCPVCDGIYFEENPRWRVPHDAAGTLPPDDSYVCSDECADEWCDINWELIEESEGGDNE